MTDLVSVVIPVYNGERYIGSTLASVVKQSYRNMEVIVVDDGSTDGTTEILRIFAQHDSRIRLFRQANKGVAAARNLGIRSARGDFIAPLDADDIWHRDRLAKHVGCLLNAPSDVGLVYSPWIMIDEAGSRRSPCMDRDRFEGVVWLRLILGNFLGNASTCLIRTECLDAVGLYDEGYFSERAQGCEDWDLYLRIARRFRFHFQPDCLIAYRQVRGSMSVDVEQMTRAYDRMMAKLPGYGIAVPKPVSRWSRAAYLFYLADRAVSARRRVLTLTLLLRLLSIDSARVVDPRLWRTLARSLLADLPQRWPHRAGVLSVSDLWGDPPRVSGRSVAASGVLWDKVRRRREDVVQQLQQTLGWPARLDGEAS